MNGAPWPAMFRSHWKLREALATLTRHSRAPPGSRESRRGQRRVSDLRAPAARCLLSEHLTMNPASAISC